MTILPGAASRRNCPPDWSGTSDDSRLGRVDGTLDLTELPETNVYEIEESESVGRDDVDEDDKESRLQGLTHRLAATEEEGADELREETEALEERIDERSGLRSG